MSAITEKRFGRFEVPDKLMREMTEEELYALFDGVYVLECTHEYYDARFRYVAASMQFDALLDGVATPTYELEIHKSESGLKSKFVKR